MYCSGRTDAFEFDSVNSERAELAIGYEPAPGEQRTTDAGSDGEQDRQLIVVKGAEASLGQPCRIGVVE
jgi:hypothetical protein